MIYINKVHDDLIGRLAKISEIGVELAEEYDRMFGIGSKQAAERMFYFCQFYGLLLMFIDEDPFIRSGCTWFCLKEIGKGTSGDWHWYTLDQLIICEKI